MFCTDCDYFTDRRDNLARHISVEHSHMKMVASLIEDILTGVKAAVGTPCEAADGEDGTAAGVEDVSVAVAGSGHEESPYLRMRNARVAEIQKEFKMLFPTFEEEVRGLRVKPKKKNKKNPLLLTSCRKSSRVPRRSFDDDHPVPVNSLTEEVTGDEEMVDNCSNGNDGRRADEQVLVGGDEGQGADDQVLAGGDNGHGGGTDNLVLVGREVDGDVPIPAWAPGEVLVMARKITFWENMDVYHVGLLSGIVVTLGDTFSLCTQEGPSLYPALGPGARQSLISWQR